MSEGETENRIAFLRAWIHVMVSQSALDACSPVALLLARVLSSSLLWRLLSS
jgi:hypothetical protein